MALVVLVSIAVVSIAIVLRLLGARPIAPGIYDALTLPTGIHLCDRDWKREAATDGRPLAVIRAQAGVEPVVVDPRPIAQCSPGPCTAVAGGACHTVIWVRVGEDRFVGYSLRGGP